MSLYLDDNPILPSFDVQSCRFRYIQYQYIDSRNDCLRKWAPDIHIDTFDLTCLCFGHPLVAHSSKMIPCVLIDEYGGASLSDPFQDVRVGFRKASRGATTGVGMLPSQVKYDEVPGTVQLQWAFLLIMSRSS